MKVLKANINSKTLFKRWLEITHVFHTMTPQQVKVLALFLYYHHELSKEITNKRILWKLVFDFETKKKIKKELGIADAGLQNILTQLRKKNVIINNQIVSTYIPTIKGKVFRVLFNFNVIDG